MAPQDLAPFVRRRPFVPFRITLTEGSTYDIRHPELCMVGRREAHIGLDAPEGPDHFFERYVIIDLLHVVKAEPLEVVPPTGSDGAASGGS